MVMGLKRARVFLHTRMLSSVRACAQVRAPRQRRCPAFSSHSPLSLNAGGVDSRLFGGDGFHWLCALQHHGLLPTCTLSSDHLLARYWLLGKVCLYERAHVGR